MSRIRTVKPELAKHELLFELEQELQAPVRFAWAMLPTCCDREGRFKWKPRALKTDILPYDECDFSRVLDAWVTRGMLVKYRVGDEWYGCIPTFRKHQVVNPRESASTFPSVTDADETQDQKNQSVTHASGTRGPREGHASGTRHVHARGEGKGREGKELGAEKNTTPRLISSRASRIPEDFAPNLEWAVAEVPDLDVEAEAAKFRDYWLSRPGKQAVKCDWPATWRTWIRKAKADGRYPRKFAERKAVC